MDIYIYIYNEELNDHFSSPNIIRLNRIEKNEMGGACTGERRDSYIVLVWKPEGKRPV